MRPRPNTDQTYTAPDLGAFSFEPKDRLPVDRRLACRVLPKAIRRGDLLTAERAMTTLAMLDRKGLWRLLHRIVFHDIGIADPGLVWAVSAFCLDPMFRAAKGGDLRVAYWLCGLLAESVKDRTAVQLTYEAKHHPNAENALRRVPNLTRNELLSIVQDRSQDLLVRAISVLSILDNAGQKSRTSRNGLAHAFHSLGVDDPIVWVALTSSNKCGDKAMGLLPLLTAQQLREPHAGIITYTLPIKEDVEGVPLYALDHRIEAARTMLRAWGETAPTLRTEMTRTVAKSRRYTALKLVLEDIEGDRCGTVLDWPTGRTVAALSNQALLHRLRISPAEWDGLKQAAEQDLPVLNELRREGLRKHIDQLRETETRYRGIDQ